MKKLELSRTFSGNSREDFRQTALIARRQQDSFRRFLESLDGPGFEFAGLNTYTRVS